MTATSQAASEVTYPEDFQNKMRGTAPPDNLLFELLETGNHHGLLRYLFAKKQQFSNVVSCIDAAQTHIDHPNANMSLNNAKVSAESRISWYDECIELWFQFNEQLIASKSAVTPST